jgi:hypothetical protein
MIENLGEDLFHKVNAFFFEAHINEDLSILQLIYGVGCGSFLELKT